MSKLSKKELLDCFDEMCMFLAIHGWTKEDERAVAIRKLILIQPEVKKKNRELKILKGGD